MDFISQLATMIGDNLFMSLGLAFVGGLVSTLTPCALSSLPLIVGYLQGKKVGDKKEALKISIVFSLGIMTTFTILGLLSGIMGKFLKGAGTWWYMFLAIIMLLSGLQLLGVISIGGKSLIRTGSYHKKGFLGAYILGLLGGALASPCATPMLAAILGFVAERGSVILGAAMLILYSLGHCIIIILGGTSIGFIENLTNSEKTIRVGNILKYILGIIIILLGMYLFYIAI